MAVGAFSDRQHRRRGGLPAAVTGIALYLAVSSIANVESKFIYFNF